MSTEQSELTYKSGATLHSDCDCCEHAAKRLAALEAAVKSLLAFDQLPWEAKRPDVFQLRLAALRRCLE